MRCLFLISFVDLPIVIQNSVYLAQNVSDIFPKQLKKRNKVAGKLTKYLFYPCHEREITVIRIFGSGNLTWVTEGKTSFPKVLYGCRREMMPQRMIILKKGEKGHEGTKQVALVSRHRNKVYRTSYTLVERWLTRTSQISFESHLFTSYVHDDKIIAKALSKFPDSSPITFTIGKLEKDRAVSLPKGYSG